jgi:hypothetical protein
MSAASNYTEGNVINALLRGIAFPLPNKTYISLHTADPGDTGAGEVNLTDWPGYVRRAAEGDAGVIGDGWAPPNDGVSTNLKQVLYPMMNGSSAVTITHFGIWDAANGGNYLCGAALYASRTLNPGDVFVFDVGSLTVRML